MRSTAKARKPTEAHRSHGPGARQSEEAVLARPPFLVARHADRERKFPCPIALYHLVFVFGGDRGGIDPCSRPALGQLLGLLAPVAGAPDGVEDGRVDPLCRANLSELSLMIGFEVSAECLDAALGHGCNLSKSVV